jgi:hypothetical protein
VINWDPVNIKLKWVETGLVPRCISLRCPKVSKVVQ